MVTYRPPTDTSTSLRLLTSGEYASDLNTANANVKLTTDTAATSTNTNSLILNGGSVTNANVTLPIASAALAGNILIDTPNNIAGANTVLGISTFELCVLANSSATISATIGTAVAGSLTLSGTGNVTLSAANAYTSTTFINGATLTYGASNAISSGGVTSVGGTLDLYGNSDAIGALSINAGTIKTGNGTLTLGGGVTTIANNYASSNISGNLALGAGQAFTVNDGLVDNDLVVSAVVSGGTVSKAGAGLMVFSGYNTYTGLTTISAGTLRLGSTGDGTNTPLGTTAAGTTISTATGALDLNGFRLGTTEPLTLSGNLAAGALQNTSGTAAEYIGLITLGAASTIISNFGDINITNTGNITGATFGLTIGGAGNGSLASNLNTTTGTLTKNGAGTWTVSGSSSYTGLTSISAGVFKLGAPGDSSNTPLGTIGNGTTITSGAVLDLNGKTLGTAEALTSVSGTGIANSGAITTSSSNNTSYSGVITLAGASRITNFGTGTFSLTGNIALTTLVLTLVTSSGTITQDSAGIVSSTSGTGGLTKEGSGTAIVAGQNTFTGPTIVSTGILQLGASGGVTNTPLGTIAGTLTVSAGAVFDLGIYSLGGSSAWKPLALNGSGLLNTGAVISSSSLVNNFGALALTTACRIINSGSGVINVTGAVTTASNLIVGGTGPTTISGSFGTAGTTITKFDSGTLI